MQNENSVTRGNCSASRALQSDAEQLSWVTEFSICTKQPLWILFLAYSSFDDCIQAWMCVILSDAQITKCLDEEMLSLVPIWIIDVETCGGKLTSTCQKWRQKIKIIILTLCTTFILHPSCKTTFPSPGPVHGNSGQVCKKSLYLLDAL